LAKTRLCFGFPKATVYGFGMWTQPYNGFSFKFVVNTRNKKENKIEVNRYNRNKKNRR